MPQSAMSVLLIFWLCWKGSVEQSDTWKKRLNVEQEACHVEHEKCALQDLSGYKSKCDADWRWDLNLKKIENRDDCYC